MQTYCYIFDLLPYDYIPTIFDALIASVITLKFHDQDKIPLKRNFIIDLFLQSCITTVLSLPYLIQLDLIRRLISPLTCLVICIVASSCVCGRLPKLTAPYSLTKFTSEVTFYRLNGRIFRTILIVILNY